MPGSHVGQASGEHGHQQQAQIWHDVAGVYFIRAQCEDAGAQPEGSWLAGIAIDYSNSLASPGETPTRFRRHVGNRRGCVDIQGSLVGFELDRNEHIYSFKYDSVESILFGNTSPPDHLGALTSRQLSDPNVNVVEVSFVLHC